MDTITFCVVLICSTLVSVSCENAKFKCMDAETGGDCEVRARTDAGWVCGRVRRAEDRSPYASFRGVPYARPPLRERRFTELEPLEPWNGTLDATEDGPACPQKNIIYGSITLQPKGMSEDCIHLNLHVPYDALPQGTQDGGKLPILVMIHGGGFNSGSGLSDLHGPEYLISKGVIVITFNYRLNVFGFLSLGSAQVPGNQGLRDMVTLLRWVRRNARAFGGDPDNVTLLGQSAGATAVHLLSMSKAAEGLFHKMILMSGTAIPNYYSESPYHSKRLAVSFLELLKINETNPEDIHKQLIERPIVDIMHANAVLQHMYGLTTFVPVIEAEYPGVTQILEGDPLKLFVKGRGSQYPTILGYTDKEAESFRYPAITLDLAKRFGENPMFLLPLRFLYSLPMENVMQLAGQISHKCFKGTPNLDGLLFCIGYVYFKYPAFLLATWRSLMKGAPTYMYQYTYKSERSLIKEALWTPYEGAAHVEDLTYIFRVNSMLDNNDVSIPPKNNDDRMKDWMTTLVSNFMRCSTPTCSEGEAQWPPVSAPLRYQHIAEPGVYAMQSPSDEETDMVQFLTSIDEEARNITEVLKKL